MSKDVKYNSETSLKISSGLPRARPSQSLRKKVCFSVWGDRWIYLLAFVWAEHQTW